MSLLGLPVELRQKIYKLISHEHLKNLSACSSGFRKDLAPLLWSFMCLGWKLKNEAVMKNLIFTNTITFTSRESHDKETLCKNFDIYIDHCGEALNRITFIGFDLDGEGRAIKKLEKLPNLRSLEFMLCNFLHKTQPITENIMQAIADLPHLETLEFQDAKVDPRAFKCLCSESFLSLKKLSLWKSRLTDPGLSLIKNLKELEVLQLRAASITHVGVKRINGLLHLKALELDLCKRIKTIPPNLHSLPLLEKLSLGSTPINDVSLLNLKSLPSLKKLSLSHCENLSIAGFRYLYSLPALTVLRCIMVNMPANEMEEVKTNMNCHVQDDSMTAEYFDKQNPWYLGCSEF